MDELYFAVVGDVHGYHNRMVAQLKKCEKRLGRTFDFVLQVGDFEAHRDEDDLRTMSAPSKYKQLGDFHQYWSGRVRYPWPIYFIGGNHEPYGFLESYVEGGCLLPHCHYLGRSQSQEIGGLEIAGLTGIYAEERFEQERPVWGARSGQSNKDFIFFDDRDVMALMELEQVDILLLHDWPEGLFEEGGEVAARGRLARRERGNPYARMLVEELKPKWVFCGHMHTRYEASWEWEDETKTHFLCLAHILEGAEAIGAFRVKRGQGARLEQLC